MTASASCLKRTTSRAGWSANRSIPMPLSIAGSRCAQKGAPCPTQSLIWISASPMRQSQATKTLAQFWNTSRRCKTPRHQSRRCAQIRRRWATSRTDDGKAGLYDRGPRRPPQTGQSLRQLPRLYSVSAFCVAPLGNRSARRSFERARHISTQPTLGAHI